ncbi:MAG: amino acid ABC transporter substrate-binding protein, partial [Candidatus Limnocylindria bacterium]
MRYWTGLLLLLMIIPPIVAAQDKDAEKLVIGYLEMADDPRYREEVVEAEYQAQPWGRPYPGAEVALEESYFAGLAAGVDFSLSRESFKDTDSMMQAVEGFKRDDIRFILVDAPREAVAELARRTRGQGILLFNISALASELRGEQCQKHLLHIAPSRDMLQDALAQFLVSSRWDEVLVLKGPTAQDAAMTAAIKASAERY